MMNRYRLGFLLCSICLLFSGCSGLFDGVEHLEMDKDFKEAKIGDYAIMLPHYVTADPTLHAEASLSYSFPDKEVYIIVIDEPKDPLMAALKDADLYKEGDRLSRVLFELQSDNIGQNATVEPGYVAVDTLIDGLEATSSEFIASVPDVQVDVAYFVTCIVGDRSTYTVMCWTTKNKRDKYRETFGQVVQSFRLTGN